MFLGREAAETQPSLTHSVCLFRLRIFGLYETRGANMLGPRNSLRDISFPNSHADIVQHLLIISRDFHPKFQKHAFITQKKNHVFVFKRAFL